MISSFIFNEIELNEHLKEIEVLKRCKNENLVNYIEHWLDPNVQRLCIITSYYKVKSLSLFKITFLSNLYQKKKDGDLDGLIQRYKIENKKLEIIEILFYLYQILSGLNHLHQNNIVHRDLKPK